MRNTLLGEADLSSERSKTIMVLLLTIVLFSLSFTVSAQSSDNGPAQQLKSPKMAFGLTRNQFSKLIPAIERQTNRLNKIFAKYSEHGTPNSAPFWHQSEIWDDLIRSRRNLRQEHGANLTAKQRAQLDAACFQLERETLSLLVDDELPYWAELLELTPRQFEGFFRLVSSDVKLKHSFLQTVPDKNLLHQKLKVLSEATEQKLNKLLLDDQREVWEKAKQRSLLAVSDSWPNKFFDRAIRQACENAVFPTVKYARIEINTQYRVFIFFPCGRIVIPQRNKRSVVMTGYAI